MEELAKISCDRLAAVVGNGGSAQSSSWLLGASEQVSSGRGFDRLDEHGGWQGLLRSGLRLLRRTLLGRRPQGWVVTSGRPRLLALLERHVQMVFGRGSSLLTYASLPCLYSEAVMRYYFVSVH